MLQHIEKINGKAYVINKFKGREGWSYLPRLTKYVFPFVGFFVSDGVDEGEIIAQLVQLLNTENQKEVEQLFIDLVSSVEVDNTKIDFDTEFSGNYDTLFMLVLQVIKLNYLESFNRLVTNLPKA